MAPYRCLCGLQPVSLIWQRNPPSIDKLEQDRRDRGAKWHNKHRPISHNIWPRPQNTLPNISRKEMPPIYKGKCRQDAAGGEVQEEDLMDRHFPFYRGPEMLRWALNAQHNGRMMFRISAKQCLRKAAEDLLQSGFPAVPRNAFLVRFHRAGTAYGNHTVEMLTMNH